MDKNLELQIEKITNTIFKDVNISSLSQYQKRQMIFSHLCDTIKYDYELLDKIHNFHVNKVRVRRDPFEELYNTINNNVGICSSISQLYKLILEQVNIKSYCVICDNETPVNHQLTLVYDSDNDTYSFDDVTSVIVKLGTKQDFFDYDIDHAKSKGQGNKVIMNGEKFVILPEDYVNYLVGRTKSFSDQLMKIPTNVYPVKNLIDLQQEM